MGAPQPQPSAVLLALAAVGIVLAAFIPALQIYLIVDDFEWLDETYPMAYSAKLLFTKTAGFFRPLVKISYFLDMVIFGAQAVFFMATTLAIHLANVALLFMLTSRMVHSVPPAFAAAVLFGISPLHAEATLWAAARPDSMLLLFTLAILLVLMREAPGRADAAAVLALGVGAAGCKESWVVLPAVVFLLLVLVRGRAVRTAVMKSVPLAGLAAAYLGVLFLLPMVTGDRVPTAYGGAPIVDGLVRIAGVIAGFVGCGGMWAGQLWQASVVYVCLAALLWWGMRAGRRVTVFGVLWMLLALLPTLNVGFHPSRYSYVPLAGLWLAAGDLLVAGVQACRPHSRRLAVVLATAAGTAVAALSLVALQAEIKDYLDFGDRHRLLAEMIQAVDREIPRDRPLLLVNRGTQRAMEDFVFLSDGMAKVGHPRPGGLWQLVDLGHLLNFVGRPFSERLVRVSEADVSWLFDSEPTVLVFSDAGFKMGAQGQLESMRARFEGLGFLPDGVEAYRFVRTRDGAPLDRAPEAAEPGKVVR